MMNTNMIALQAFNGKYVNAAGSGQGIMASAPSIGASEIFKLIDLGNSHMPYRRQMGNI